MFAMKEYPHDVMPLYSQGYSVARYLIANGGKQNFLEFLADGMRDENWKPGDPRCIMDMPIWRRCKSPGWTGCGKAARLWTARRPPDGAGGERSSLASFAQFDLSRTERARGFRTGQRSRPKRAGLKSDPTVRCRRRQRSTGRGRSPAGTSTSGWHAPGAKPIDPVIEGSLAEQESGHGRHARSDELWRATRGTR